MKTLTEKEFEDYNNLYPMKTYHMKICNINSMYGSMGNEEFKYYDTTRYYPRKKDECDDKDKTKVWRDVLDGVSTN